MGCLVREDIRCSQQVKWRIASGQETLNRKKRLLCGTLDAKLRKMMVKYSVWGVLLYGADIWTLRKEEEKRLEAFEIGKWRRMERILLKDRVINEVFGKVGEKRRVLDIINRLGQFMRCLLYTSRCV